MNFLSVGYKPAETGFGTVSPLIRATGTSVQGNDALHHMGYGGSCKKRACALETQALVGYR